MATLLPDQALAEEKLTSRYVYCYKAQPARRCQPTPDWEEAGQELGETRGIARGCCDSLVQKDTTSSFDEPQRCPLDRHGPTRGGRGDGWRLAREE